MTAMRPAGRQGREVAREVRCTDELEHHVVRTALGERVGRDNVDDATRAADLGDRRSELLVADGRDHACARAGRELHRRDPDAPGRAVDQDTFPQCERALREERVVRGREDLGEAACLRPAETGGNGERDALVHDGQLGLRAAPDDRHHPVADREARDCRPDRHDLAGELEPGDVGRCVRRRGVQALALHHVGAVQPCGPHPYEELAVAGLGICVVAPEHGAVDDRCRVHRATVRVFRPPRRSARSRTARCPAARRSRPTGPRSCPGRSCG